MTLTTNGKNYIAQNFGIGDCFVASGLTWTAVAQDGSTSEESGGTKNIVGRLATTTMYKEIRLKTPRVGTFTYAMVKSANGGNDFDMMNDAVWIGNNDGSPAGENQYCKTATPTPPSTTKPVTPPLQVTIAEGNQCTPGAPKVILDVSGARPYFKTTPVLYVGVMGINVTNVNQGGKCFGYFVWEMRMWKGEAGDTCPLTEAEVTEISRFLAVKSDYKTISPQILGTDQTGMVNGSFEIPTGTHGTYTLCLSLWGNYDKQALLDELAAANYDENVVWP